MTQAVVSTQSTGELMDGASLADILEQHDICPLSEPQMALVCKDMLKALSHMHSLNCIHRDIKSDNILLNIYGQVKLADFGFSRQLTSSEEKRTSVIGTPYWMAPEIIGGGGGGYTFAVDLWSLGIVLMEMCLGDPPYLEHTPMKALLLISQNGVPPLPNPEIYSDDLLSFLEICLRVDPEQRLSASEMLFHEFCEMACGDEDMVTLLERCEEAKRGYDEEMAEYAKLSSELASLLGMSF
eukprot:TRINITY_DN7543_c0_g1_i2.p1 TRINITY_DN7543_c0_g1~~TRINITY_DN7543_c0_g1_i2.p1  ORF type:complete len:240 (-),score=45.84 TRINITY_DN7543_c0_g1_i2:88-807(-)